MSETNGQNAPRIFCLTRASTLKQGESPAMQREIMARACQSLALGEPQFLDEPLGSSARSKKFVQRPMGLWCLRNLRKGDTLMVTAIDRLGRNFLDAYSTIDLLFTRGVRIIILKGWGGQALDLKKSTDRIMLAILAWVADVEAERVSERTKEGLNHRRDNGLCAGRSPFTYIQAFDVDGTEIPTALFDKKKGHYKQNIPDRDWLNQLCELLILQKTTRARGRILLDYCRERKFVNHAGKEWWRGTVYVNDKGAYMNQLAKYIKKVRRLAVLGKLTEEWNVRVLSITGDTPAEVRPKWKGKPRPTATHDDENRSGWTADQWRFWWENANESRDECVP